MTNFLPFALPDICEDEINEVVNSLRSGWLTTGPKTKQFEADFAEFIGEDAEAISVNSATAGLHLALESIGIGFGDEVITTPYTFTATAEVVRYLGAHPVFVDISPDNFNIDVTKIESAITPNTKAIVPVHVGGLSCDMAAILSIAKKYGLRVVEDAAHALPTTCGGKLIGRLDSDIVVYSFYATKTITTGEGGMVVTRNPDLAKRCRVMRLHGMSRDAFDRYTSTKPAWHYDIIAPGFKYNLTDIASSIGIHQLKKAWTFQQKRQQMAEFYDKNLAGLPIILPPHSANGDVHAWHLYAIQLRQDCGISRNDFIQRMSDNGIGCSVHFIPLHIQPYWRDTYNLKPADYPNALAAYENEVSLPLYTKMTTADQERVVAAIRAVITR